MRQSTRQITSTRVKFPLSGSDRQEILAYLQYQPAAHYMQSLNWLDVIGPRNGRFIVSRDEDGRIVASSLIEITTTRIPFFKFGEISRGPVVASVEFLAPHLEFVLEQYCAQLVTLRVNPFVTDVEVERFTRALQELGFRPRAGSPHYSDTILIDLADTSTEQLWSKLRRSTRTAINKAQKLGLAIRQDSTQAAFRDFAERYTAFAGRRGLAPIDREMAVRIHNSFSATNAPAAILLSALVANSIVGQILLMPNGKSLVYQWGWNDGPDTRGNLPIMHSLIWSGISSCLSTGHTLFDLGGYWRKEGDSNPINHFKLGFGKDVVRFCAAQEYVCSATRYGLWSRLRKARRWVTGSRR